MSKLSFLATEGAADVSNSVVETHKVSCVYTAPTALRAIRRDDPDAALMSKYDLSSLRSLLLAGERSEPNIIKVYQTLLTKLAAPGAIVNDKCAPSWPSEYRAIKTLTHSNLQLLEHRVWFPDHGRSAQLGVPAACPPSRICRPAAPWNGPPDRRRRRKGGQAGRHGQHRPRNTAPAKCARHCLEQRVAVSGVSFASPLTTRRRPLTHLTCQRAYFDRFRGKGDWYDSGDAGVMDEQGFVSVLSRADDIIKYAL